MKLRRNPRVPWTTIRNRCYRLSRYWYGNIGNEHESDVIAGYEAVRLPEDSVLAGFTPLMYMEPAAAYTRQATAPLRAEHALRTRKLLFFGTE